MVVDVFNAHYPRGAIGQEVMIVAAIVPDFVGPTRGRKVSDDDAIIVDDQAAREAELASRG
jgi:hypothetical protein